MKKTIILLAMLAAAGLAGAQMFAQMFGAAVGTPIPAVAWYKLDGNALDTQGAYNGTWGGTTAYTNGYFPGTQSAMINGYSNYITAGDTATLQAGTITAWIYVANPTDANRNYIVSKFSTVAVGEFILRVTPTGTIEFLSVYGTTASATGASVLSSNTWYHVAATYTSGSQNVYLSGGVQATTTQVGTILDTVQPFNIGTRYNAGTPSYYFSGRIDDVRIFNRVLSAANIQRIMTGQDVQPIEELQ